MLITYSIKINFTKPARKFFSMQFLIAFLKLERELNFISYGGIGLQFLGPRFEVLLLGWYTLRPEGILNSVCYCTIY